MKALLISLIVAGIGLIGFAASKPDTFFVERVLRMRASPNTIFPLISDFKNWGNWSPFVANDPSMKVTLSPTTSGMGATYEWASNGDYGRGRIEITSVSALKRVRYDVHRFEPAITSEISEFSLQRFGDFTKVIWRVQGPLSFGARLSSIFTTRDEKIGPELDQGLRAIKALVE